MRFDRRVLLWTMTLNFVFLAAVYTNCSGGGVFRRDETVAGNPLVELSIARFTPDAGGASYRLCARALHWQSADGVTESRLAPISDLILEREGAELGAVRLPPGRYVKLELELDRNCGEMRSLRLVNAQGVFDTTAAVRLSFRGDLQLTAGVKRVQLDVQPLITRLNEVVSESELATFSDSAFGSFAPETLPEDLVVEPAFAGSGDWNEYRRADGSACTGDEPGAYSACVHGGEARKVTAAGHASCEGLTLDDALDAFHWNCRIEDGVATFRSSGLKAHRGLRDLLDVLAFKYNRVVLRRSGVALVSSRLEPWWRNRVVLLPENAMESVLTLDDVDSDGTGPDRGYLPGTVFVTSRDVLTNGYNINLDGAAIVTLAGAAIKFAGLGAPNCDTASGETSSLGVAAMFCAGSQKFLWLEAKLDGRAAGGTLDKGAVFANVSFSRVYRSELTGILGTRDPAGFSFESSRALHVSQLRIDSTSGDALALWDTHDSWLSSITVSNNYARGLRLVGSQRNVVTGIMAGNNGWSVLLEGSSHNVITGAVAVSAAVGFRLAAGSTRNTVQNAAVIATALDVLEGSNDNTFSHIAILRGGRLNLNGSSRLKFANVAVEWGEVRLEASSNNQFSGFLLVGSPSCLVSGGTNPGLTNTCQNQGASDATRVVVDMSNAMFGTVTADDPFNASDVSGAAAYEAILDWVHFTSPWRTWGQSDGYSFQCGPGQTCRIADLRLRAGDSSLLNRSGAATIPNAPFVHGAACPAAVQGDRVFSDTQTAPRAYLLNAAELVADGAGNDNGLCESGESCVYTPNFGAYQGDGDVRSRECVFQDGTISGVRMFAHPANGI
ncbi:MAG TPA: right-handed parallel beta-helix repeat-containing protein [Bdellovibrionales bacterium]|nr:right-handed parallel beta-helix repeat-containing protein [Bdellovibrionales bacterium]